MKLRQLRNDDDAVSPVIGVILMVAITVILAAVIATFVLGLGEQVSDTAPQANFDFDWDSGVAADTTQQDFNDVDDSSNGELTVTHAGGATIEAENLGLGGDVSVDDLGSAGNKFGAKSELSAGTSFTVEAAPGDNIRIIWQNDQGTDSATLRTYQIPS